MVDQVLSTLGEVGLLCLLVVAACRGEVACHCGSKMAGTVCWRVLYPHAQCTTPMDWMVAFGDGMPSRLSEHAS